MMVEVKGAKRSAFTKAKELIPVDDAENIKTPGNIDGIFMTKPVEGTCRE